MKKSQEELAKELNVETLDDNTLTQEMIEELTNNKGEKEDE